jgi:gamma-glutamylcyclotransferase (GGCT)/AIG2-like uncharacterized protein YtfP
VLLFFYGTLIAGNALPLARAVHQRLEPLGPGTTRGQLRAIADAQGWFPALVAGEGWVHGQLYRTGPGFADDNLIALDAFEDYRPGDEQGSLYLRRPIPVESSQGAMEAQTYLFNGPVPATAPLIENGSFATWLAEWGLRPFQP